MKRCGVSLALFLLAGAAPAVAGPFTSGNLVVMRVSGANPAGGGAIVIDEYTRGGALLANSVALPVSGVDAVSLPDVSNHDRHLHRSTDRRFIAFAAYGVAPGATDPSATAVASVPRVAGLLKYDGTVDLSTKMTDAYDFTTLRSATTTDGQALWVSGDNASGATLSGGLRYVLRGGSTTVNLSQVQTFGQPRQPDNVRDAVVFSGQLYDCSGSNATIGKGVFQVGSGLPTSGAQTLSAAFNGSDGASASSFVLLDMDPTVPGVDVLYSAASAITEGVRKYVKTSAGTWVYRGAYLFTGIDHVIAEPNADGSVTVFASGVNLLQNINGVITFVDQAALTGTLSGTAGALLITAPEGWTIGGIDFAPEAPSCYANCDGSTIAPVLNVNDFTCFLNRYAIGDSYANCDGSSIPPVLNVNDFTCFVNRFAVGCP